MYKRTPLEKRLRLRGRVWSFWGYDYSGREYTASTKQTDYKAALKAARKIERDRAVPPADPTAQLAQKFTLEEALGLLARHDKRVKAAPNTVTFHVNCGRHLVEHLDAETPLVDIKAKLIDYVDTRLDEGASGMTIYDELRVLRQAVGLARDQGMYTGDPKLLRVTGFTTLGEVYDPDDTWLERVEWIEALVAHTSSNPDKHRVDRRDDMVLYVNLGLRRRELTKIRPEDVDLRKRIATIRMPRRVRKAEPRKTGLKTKKSQRELPLNDVVYAIFQRRMRNAPLGKPLFTDWGSGNRDLKSNWARARTWLLEQAEATGGKRARADLDAILPQSLTFNALRRTFCSLMKNAGVSLEDCAELLGHEDTAMVKLVYGQTAMDTLRKAVAKLPEMTLPPQAIPTRTQKVSRRHRQRLRAQARAEAAEAAAGGSQACPSSEPTDRVCDRNPMRIAGSEGAG